MTSGNYLTNRTWSDRFLPEISSIVGGHLLKQAPDLLDMTQATDLLMLDAKDVRVAARVRRPGFASRYPHQFTIRSRVPSGADTELTKIINGAGDLMFYGHSDDDQRHISRWWLIDLNAFRAALIRRSVEGSGIHWGSHVNDDGTAFTWFDVRSFPNDPPLVVAQSEEIGF